MILQTGSCSFLSHDHTPTTNMVDTEQEAVGTPVGVFRIVDSRYRTNSVYLCRNTPCGECRNCTEQMVLNSKDEREPPHLTCDHNVADHVTTPPFFDNWLFLFLSMNFCQCCTNISKVVYVHIEVI